LESLPKTLFISHTSLDDALIKGGEVMRQRGSVWWVCSDAFPDPFYHSQRTGGAQGYEGIVGLALLAATRVLVIWSERAAHSKYVLAETLLATEMKKRLAAYVMPGAPPFPVPEATVLNDLVALRALLTAWR
jgi:hypothetical protein